MVEFYKKYKQMIKSVYVRKKYLEVVIKASIPKVQCNPKSYKALQERYDYFYYMNDCGGYQIFVNSKGHVLDGRLQRLLQIIDAQENDIILDVGCGRGELANAISQYCKRVDAIDYSRTLLILLGKCLAKTRKLGLYVKIL